MDKLNSPYGSLHELIDTMLNESKTPAIISLVKQLHNTLACFEDNPNHNSSEVKNTFKIKFLHELHSLDKTFSEGEAKKMMPPLIRKIHTSLYMNVFSDGKLHVPSSSMFSTTMKGDKTPQSSKLIPDIPKKVKF